MVMKPTFIFGSEDGTQVISGIGIGMGVISLVNNSLVFIFMRKLKNTASVAISNEYAWICFIGSCIAILVVLFGIGDAAGKTRDGIRIPQWNEVGWLVLNGLFALMAQISFTVALKIEEAGLVSLVRTSDILVSYIIQIAIFQDDAISLISVVGAAIVFLGVSLTALRNWLKTKPGQFNALWNILSCGQPRYVTDK